MTLRLDDTKSSPSTVWPEIVGPQDFGSAHAAELQGQINLDYAATTPALRRRISTDAEHHVNLLPWRAHEVDHLPFTSSAEELVEEAASALRRARSEGQPYVSHLLGTPATTAEAAVQAGPGEETTLPGAVRASIGLGVQPEHIDTVLNALHELHSRRPR
jgi:selenocysteine lyase/cysteine desulfurase